MIKKGIMLKVSSLVVATTMLIATTFTPIAYAYTVTAQYEQEEPIAEGVTLKNISYLTTEGPLNLDVLKVDLTNPYVHIDTINGTQGKLTNTQTVRQMATENGAIAAVNGGFFQMDEDAPINTSIMDGKIISSPAQRNDMSSLTINNQGYPNIDVLKFTGMVQAANGVTAPLFGVNKPDYLTTDGGNSITNRLNLYTPQWGDTSRGYAAETQNITQVVVKNDQVQAINHNQTGTSIPTDGFVLAGQGTASDYLFKNFSVGSKVTVDYQVYHGDDISSAIGGQSKLVDFGKRAYMPQNITGNRARTAVGYTQDRKTMFIVVVEGGKTSRGMTQEEMADLMISLGCWQALNLDGGGSSTMVARALGDNQLTLMNAPQAGVERAVPDSLAIFSTAPAAPLAGLKLRGDKTVVISTSRSYTVKGYDEHFNPYPIEASEVRWSISPDLGSFEGNTLTATKGGEGQITARVGDISQSIPVRVIDSSEIAKIEVQPGQLALNEGATIPLTLKVVTKSGAIFPIQVQDLQWQVQGNIGQVEGNNFVAGSTPAVGSLTGRLDQTTVTIPVVVGSKAAQPFYYFEKASDLKFTNYPQDVTGALTTVKTDQPVFRGSGAVKLAYDFTKSTGATKAAYATFTGNGLVLPGQPLGIGLWVYGNQGNGHWLRAQVEDKNGVLKTVNLADKVNWQGWQRVTAQLPAGLSYPVKIKNIYLVETDAAKADQGAVYLDELFLLNPITQADLEHPTTTLPSADGQLNPSSGTNLVAGNYQVNFPEAAVQNPVNVTFGQEVLNLPSPGLRPVGDPVRIAAEQSSLARLEKPAGLEVNVPQVNDPASLVLMRWQPERGWVYVPSQIVDGKLKSKVEDLGLYGLFTNCLEKPEFSDIADSWALKEIQRMADLGLVKGYSADKFGPLNNITRAQFVTILARTFGWTTENTTSAFKDQLPDYAKAAINTAVARGVITGFADQTFRPNEVITRAQMAAIMDRTLSLPEAQTATKFVDDQLILAWAKGAVTRAQAAGLLQGNDGKFRPNDTATRAEATVVIYRMLSYYVL